MNTRVEIVRMRLGEITPAGYNPRRSLKPGEREYEQIKASLGKFGLVEPLVWNRRTGRLVGGHQRLAILLGEGETEADVSVVDLDPGQEKALNIALNRSGLWDFDSLGGLLEELESSEGDLLRVTGYDAADVADLVSRAEAPPSLDELERELHVRPERAGRGRMRGSEATLTLQLPGDLMHRFRGVLERVPGKSLPERMSWVCDAVEDAMG